MDRSGAHDRKGPRRIEVTEPEDETRATDDCPEASECPFAPEAGGAAAAETALTTEEEGRAAEEEMGKLQEMLADLEQRCTFAEDQHLRVVAELQNYKRRVQQERDQLARYALEGLLTELIPVLDNFERAMEVTVDSPDGECLMTGVKMIYDQIQNVLAGYGAARIDALGQDFDPHLHEAIEKEPSTALPPNVVVRELAKGYQLNGRLLRPAKVRVTVRPEGEAEG